MNQHILVIEDDAALGPSIVEGLNREGFSADLKTTLASGEKAWNQGSYSLILLDWMLPDGQGIDLLKRQTQAGRSVPVILLTARSDVIDKVLGLETGAEDYVTKPFEPRELIARIRSRIRSSTQKAGLGPQSSTLQEGRIKLLLEERKTLLDGQDVVLTKMEFDLLRMLMENPGKVFSREELLNQVWGFENYPTTRTVDTHVLQLRTKLVDAYFETVRGIGYRFSGPGAAK